MRPLVRAGALAWAALAGGWVAPPVALLLPARGRPGGIGHVLRAAGAPRARAPEPSGVPRNGRKAPVDGGAGQHQERRRAIAAAVSGRAGTVVWQMAMEGGLSRRTPPSGL